MLDLTDVYVYIAMLKRIPVYVPDDTIQYETLQYDTPKNKVKPRLALQ